MIYEITQEAILEASKLCPKTKKVLEVLFPAAFEDKKPYLKIGSVLTRKNHEDNNYALLKFEGQIKMLNITHGSFWNADREINEFDLVDGDRKTITLKEFKKITGIEKAEAEFILIR